MRAHRDVTGSAQTYVNISAAFHGGVILATLPFSFVSTIIIVLLVESGWEKGPSRQQYGARILF
jgi:hypothetical protein